MRPERAVFCDFDGTISAHETFFSMLRRFTPELANELVPQILAFRLSLRHGVRQLVETIPSTAYPAICEHARAAGLRPGLAELLDALDAEHTPFVVVSSGLRGMIEAALGPLAERVAAIYAVDVDCAGPTLTLRSDFELGDELLAKVEVMKRHPARELVAIGDSITDVKMALRADRVFARDWLAEHLTMKGHPFEPWGDFFDVCEALRTKA